METEKTKKEIKRNNEALWQCILVEVYESNMYGLVNKMNRKKLAYAKHLYKKRGGGYINVERRAPNT